MGRSQPNEPTILVIFGCMGDLTWRKLAPALYNLVLDQKIPPRFAVIGLDVRDAPDGGFDQRMKDGAQTFCECGRVETRKWGQLAGNLSFIAGDFGDPTVYNALSAQFAACEKDWGEAANHIFYLATPPGVMETIINGISKAKLARPRDRTRIVVEKPFGHDLASAVRLNRLLTKVFNENQVYRIDHYLGKETVQNILALRFANAIFEPIWNRRYIDHVQITVAETVGVEHRGAYYEHAGALRDMIQNHLMQVLTMIAMEPMVSFDADDIRNKKVEVLRALRPIKAEQVDKAAVRGQYGPGVVEGEKVVGYRSEPGVAPDSAAETFAAVKLYVDNWRWQDVPFYLRTGKRMPMRASEVTIQFKPVPHQSFPLTAANTWQPNRLVVHVQPQEGIVLYIQAMQPGTSLALSQVNMRFSYQETFKTRAPEAYETLLADVFVGDATLYMRADQVEASWAALTPILEAWATAETADFPNYAAGSWGPEAAEQLIAADGRNWQQPAPEQGLGEQGGGEGILDRESHEKER